MVLKIKLKGNIETLCDRCLEKMELAIAKEDVLVVKIGEEGEENGEELIVISKDDQEVDLSQYFYEAIITSIPFRKVHEEGDTRCNPEMIAKLSNFSSSGDSSTEIDPRWEILNKLKENN